MSIYRQQQSAEQTTAGARYKEPKSGSARTVAPSRIEGVSRSATSRRASDATLPAWPCRIARMISAVPQPSAVPRIILARQTCFCGALRLNTIASS